MRFAIVLHTSVERMMPIQISTILQALRNKVQLYLEVLDLTDALVNS